MPTDNSDLQIAAALCEQVYRRDENDQQMGEGADRAGFCAAYRVMTGSNEAARPASISTFSDGAGGVAVDAAQANSWLFPVAKWLPAILLWFHPGELMASDDALAVAEKLPFDQILVDFSGRWMIFDRKSIYIPRMNSIDKENANYWYVDTGLHDTVLFTFTINIKDSSNIECTSLETTAQLSDISRKSSGADDLYTLSTRPVTPTEHPLLSKYMDKAAGLVPLPSTASIYRIDDPSLARKDGAFLAPYCRNVGSCVVHLEPEKEIGVRANYNKDKCGLGLLAPWAREIFDAIKLRIAN